MCKTVGHYSNICDAEETVKESNMTEYSFLVLIDEQYANSADYENFTNDISDDMYDRADLVMNN